MKFNWIYNWVYDDYRLDDYYVDVGPYTGWVYYEDGWRYSVEVQPNRTIIAKGACDNLDGGKAKVEQIIIQEGEDMQLINLTPHPVTFVTENGETILELPGCPNPPRASETRETQGKVNGIPVNKVAMGTVQDLPEARPGVGYIVSRIVAEAARRSDLYIPDCTVRDEQGRIIGCRALAQV